MKRGVAVATTVAVAFVALVSGCTLIYGLFPPIAGGEIAWSATAREYNGQNGHIVQFTLPPGGTEYGIWGTDVYTDDSSVGTAAVHAGVINFTTGGTVKIRILAGRASYTGSTRNGVTSDSYGEWDGSFEFVE